MTSRKKVSVLIINDEPLRMVGLATIINRHRSLRVCGETREAPKARELFLKHRPHVVVLGFMLQRGHGIDLIKDFRRMNPKSHMVVVAEREDTTSVQRAFRAGARGYATIKDEPAEIITTIERVLQGSMYASGSVSCEILKKLATTPRKSKKSEEADLLTDRELQVFGLIGQGIGPSRIATEMQLSVKTIESHRQHIKEKLRLLSGAELNERAHRWMRAHFRHAC